MSTTDDSIEVDLETATNSDNSPELVIIDDVKRAVPPEDGIAELRKQLDNERAARADAERRANEFAQRAHSAQNEVEDTNLHLVNNAIDTVQRNNDALKMQYAEAMAIGDYTRAADINSIMTDNSSKLRDLENGRQAMQERPKAPPPPPIMVDPVEDLAARLSPRSAQWLRAHPECATDARLFNKMVAAHQLVINDGIEADSDDYFAAVEDILKLDQRAPVNRGGDAMADAAKVTKSRTSPPAAPVSRSSSPAATRPGTVRLTQAEKEAAEMSGMTYADYWKSQQEMRRQGRIQ